MLDSSIRDSKHQNKSIGKSTPGPEINTGKHAAYFDVFVFVDRLNKLS